MPPAVRGQYASPPPMYRQRADGLLKGKIYVMGAEAWGGSITAECLDPETDEWTVVPCDSMTEKKRTAYGTASLDGKVYVVGGYKSGGVGQGVLRSVECFDPSTEQWSDVAPMNAARCQHAVAALDNKIYAVGGDSTGSGNYIIASVECFDPSTGVWSMVAPIRLARTLFGMAAVGGKLYAMGGSDENGDALSSVECFDPSTGVWSAVADMGTARVEHGVAAVDGKLYAVGGQDEDETTLSSVECFDPSTGVWSAVAAMNTTRAAHGVAVVDF